MRCNELIRISPVRLIDENDQQLGIVELKDALARARAVGQDLVEVAPQARPPVCHIMDYGKWKYAQRKKEQKSKSKRHETELKEIRIKTPKIGEHDLQIKLAHAREFLARGDRVQFTLRFRGRELAHIDEGQKIFQRVRETLAEVCKIESEPRREGRSLTMMVAPGVGRKATAAAKAPAPAPAAAKVPAPAPAPVTAAAKPSAPDPAPATGAPQEAAPPPSPGPTA